MKTPAIDQDLAELVRVYPHDFRPHYACLGAKWRAHKWRLARYWPTRVAPPWPATVKVVGVCERCGNESVFDFRMGIRHDADRTERGSPA